MVVGYTRHQRKAVLARVLAAGLRTPIRCWCLCQLRVYGCIGARAAVVGGTNKGRATWIPRAAMNWGRSEVPAPTAHDGCGSHTTRCTGGSCHRAGQEVARVGTPALLCVCRGEHAAMRPMQRGRESAGRGICRAWALAVMHVTPQLVWRLCGSWLRTCRIRYS